MMNMLFGTKPMTCSVSSKSASKSAGQAARDKGGSRLIVGSVACALFHKPPSANARPAAARA
jgi:hypothetical protein